MAGVRAGVNYLAPDTPSSLFRTGALKMRRDLSGSDSGLEGVRFVQETVTIEDGRDAPGTPGQRLGAAGFAFVEAPLSAPGLDGLDFLDHAAVVGAYYDDCEARIAVATGATAVHAFDHNVRSVDGQREGKRISVGQAVQGPARVVHGDYTLTSAPQRLRDLAEPPRENDTYGPRLGARDRLLDPDRVEAAIESGRYAFVNLWRNIDARPVASDPLALCDARTVAPADLAVFEIHYADRIGENYWAKPSSAHRWVTFPALTRDEALLIKQWDSAGPLARSGGAKADADDPDAPCSFSFHTSYFDPETMADAPARWSIEVRCVVFF